MTTGFSARTERWRPARRPDWVQRINEEGALLDMAAVVPLDARSLIEAAQANTGLSDFGSDDWREPFEILLKSLNEEAELNLMGRLMTRSDLLILLEQRLQIEETYKRFPQIEDEQIRKPLMIIGQGRSGTSVLQNILARDPDHNVLLHWNTYFPCPPPEKERYDSDPRIERAAGLISQLTRVVPEVEAMHEFDARLPIENIHLHALSFRSPGWFNSFAGQVPTYNEYMSRQDAVIQFEYEKRVLKILQWKNPCRNWLFKSPYSILDMPTLLKVFPDTGFIWTHRDPVKALSSMVNLIGTLFWSRSDAPFIGGSLEMYTNAAVGSAMLSKPIEWLERGDVPRSQLCNVHYQDLVADPLKVTRQIYEFFGIEMSDAALAAMSKYMADNPRSSRPAHVYKSGDSEQIAIERQAYKQYQEYFAVPNEQ
ncbi:MAG: sulfotransferase [Steroidobacteraceae bacterium]